MEQFDPETQKTFNHAAKIDPFGDSQAEYEHARRRQTSAESLRAGTRSIQRSCAQRNIKTGHGCSFRPSDSLFRLRSIMANTCETCRFWSDRIAGNCDTGMEALCLNEDSPFYSTFVTENSWCPKWDYNAWGAIDELGAPDDYDDDPEEKDKGQSR